MFSRSLCLKVKNSNFGPPAMGSLRTYVRVPRDICKSRIFLHAAPSSLLIIECLRVSGIACTLFLSEHITLSEVSRAVWVRESHRAGGEFLRRVNMRATRSPLSSKALYNRGVKHRPAKKVLKNLHICNFCSIFAPDFEKTYCKQ